MRSWLAIVIIALLPAVLASQEAEDLFASETVDIDVTVSSDLTLRQAAGGEFEVEYVQADLFFFPKDDGAQRVTRLFTKPEAERRADALRFRWENPETTQLSYEAQSMVTVSNVFPRVSKKIPFPLTTVPAEARQYLQSSDHIDSTHPAIVNLANRLAQGKDDLWVVVSDIAIWTKTNIAYNLSTLTADVSQKASWVLENKYGVCDELTSVFIAMLRALGIPARFVSGVSYTASPLFPERWGAHGWAEVYFPDIGWIPFDPTFGEFGWIDPGHVKMITSIDPVQPGVRLEWRGVNADLQFTEPDIDASIRSVGMRLPPVLALAVKPLYEEVGFGSYNLAQATVENLQPYYVTTEVRLARVHELDVLEPYDHQVVLKPREKKTLFWRVRVSPDLSERFAYTIPLGVYTVRNDSVVNTFIANTKGGEHSKAEVTRAMNTLAEEEEEVVAQNLALQCSTDKDTLYPDEHAEVTCSMRNLGTMPLRSVRVCMEDTQCSALDIGIGQTRELSLIQGFTKPGATTLFVRASNAETSRSIPLAFVMKDFPAINITGLTMPRTVAYGQLFSTTFVLNPVSKNIPKKVRVVVHTNIARHVFEMPELAAEQAFEVEMRAQELSLGTTNVVIDATFEDDRGRAYHAIATASVELTDVPFFARLWLWIRSFFE